MALNLDPRQRAMLQEMGITLWMPSTAVAASPAAPVPQREAVAVAGTQEAVAPAHPAVVAAPARGASTPTAPSPGHTAPALPAVAAVTVTSTATPAAPVAAAASEASPSAEWQIAPAVQAYPTATGGSPQDAWLVIWEAPNPSAPLEGDTGKLLHHMLRALWLHHSPHVWIAGVQRPGHEALPVAGVPAQPVAWQSLSQGLAAHVQHTQPARILVLGMHAARAVLGSEEALGRLRAQVHQVQQIPTVVSYDPAYLLRSPHAKPAAWADLCRAHALRPPSS
jgi:uracil-DNA glycosylase family 4